MADRNNLIRRGCVYILACLLVVCLAGADQPVRAAPLSAPTFTVNSISDVVASPPLDNGICETAPGNQTCTLRAAIMKANHWPGGGVTIAFAPQLSGQAIVLTTPAAGPDDETTGDLHVMANMTIIGAGARRTIISGNGSQWHDRLITVDATAALTLTGVTLQGGRPSESGGAIFIGFHALTTIMNSAVTGNQTIGSGGGIFNDGGTLTVYNSTISGNQGHGYGGGIVMTAGTLAVYSSTIGGNQSQYGAGIDAEISSTVTLVNSTVTSNTAVYSGGGLGANSSVDRSTPGDFVGMSLVNSTVSSNVAGTDGGGVWVGPDATVTLFNATIANNLGDINLSATGAGGGIFNSITGTVQLQNSLLARNFVEQPLGQSVIVVPDDCHGTLTSLDYNLISDLTGCTLAASAHDQTNIGAMLGPLQDNGGSTWTHALLPGSPAIDAGNPNGCNDQFGASLHVDQRGAPRPANGAGVTVCDIGAYERQRALDLPLLLK